MSIMQLVQQGVDMTFVEIVADFVDLHRTAEKIISANGGWED